MEIGHGGEKVRLIPLVPDVPTYRPVLAPLLYARMKEGETEEQLLPCPCFFHIASSLPTSASPGIKVHDFIFCEIFVRALEIGSKAFRRLVGELDA